MRLIQLLTLGGLLLAGSARTADAHFLWLVPEPAERPTSVKLYFGESAAPDDPDLLDKVAGVKAVLVGGRRSEPTTLTFEKKDDALVAKLPEKSAAAPVVLRHTYGVVSRGEDPFLLQYYAKAYPSVLPGSWTAVGKSELLPLEVVPKLEGSEVVFEVLWEGTPAKGAMLTIEGPGLSEKLEGTTDEHGHFRTKLGTAGLYSVRAKKVDMTAGEHEGKKYKEVRHYSTLSLPYSPTEISPASQSWANLPRGVTSFGGAIAGDSLYIYGGHYGEAHRYSSEGQSGDFLRLNLHHPSQWETLPGGPKLTGLAMVEHGGKLYRVGGFTAKNGEKEDQSLWSQPDFARFDPKSGNWESLPPLPEGRSSHDAAVVGNTLYVVGGWQLQGAGESKWHDTAFAVDLSAPKLEWKTIASPQFHRRALALAAWQNKLYVLGGMQEDGGTTTRVAVYDPAANTWSEGPALLGSGMDGFGCAAFACGDRLFATTMSGSIQRLSSDGSRWEFIGQLAHPRFFHRILPSQGHELVIVGGASMATGKIEELERVPVALKQASAN